MKLLIMLTTMGCCARTHDIATLQQRICQICVCRPSAHIVLVVQNLAGTLLRAVQHITFW
eukprot:m.4285 g.4285  ORF g.4285 m.4285 type:complete len:60 (-) comp3441_c0_seq1:22-201(-)